MAMFLRRFSDHRSEPLEQQPKNGLTLVDWRVRAEAAEKELADLRQKLRGLIEPK